MIRFPSAPIVVFFALGFFGCAHLSNQEHRAGARTPAPWPHEVSDLKPEPTVTWGRLDNGLRYALLPHGMPRRRASVFLLVQAGSYHERANELGYAHFVEHMAFRGPRASPRDGVASPLQRLGVASGAHMNAATSPFETKYYLNDLPSDDPAALPLALAIFRDVADGVAFEENAVAQERGVIFSEERSRSGTIAQARPDELEFLPPRSDKIRWPELAAAFANTRLPRRYPLGADETLRAATPKKLRAFYDRWYRPERMILAVAGDISPTEIEQLIQKTFSGLTGRGRAPSEIEIETPRPIREGNVPVYFQDSDHEPVMRIVLSAARPWPGPDTVARRREALVGHVALAMLERRVVQVSEKADSPLISGETGISHVAPFYQLPFLRAAARPPVWSQALTLLDLETRRAAKHGFSAEEFASTISREKTRANATARYTRAQPSAELASALAFSIARQVVFTSADDDRRLTEAQLDELTVDEVNLALGKILPAGRLAVAVHGPLTSGQHDGALARQALSAGAAAPLPPYAPLPPPRPFPYTHFGAPGPIAAQEHSPTLDAELIQFANGVRLNLKRTDFEPGQVRTMIRFGGGRLLDSAAQPGLSWRVFAWPLGGLRDLTRDEERAALIELAGTYTLTSSGSDFRLLADLDPEKLPLLLQAFAAYFVHPAFREEDWPRSLEVTRQTIARYENTASGVAEISLAHVMAGQHPAERPLKLADISQRTLAELKSWLLPQLAHGPLEIAIVGDIEPAAAIDAVANTFGALPPRSPTDPYVAERQTTFPPLPAAEILRFDGQDGVAAVAFAWPAPESTTYPERLRGHVLADILAYRLRVKLRDEMGATYSPSASFVWNDTLRPPPAYLACIIEVAPDDTERIAAAARSIAEALARDGVSAEEFERARRPRMHGAESDLRSNEWWLDAIAEAQTSPRHAQGWASAVESYRSATLEEINALARRVLVKEREYQLTALPKGAVVPKTQPSSARL